MHLFSGEYKNMFCTNIRDLLLPVKNIVCVIYIVSRVDFFRFIYFCEENENLLL